MVIISPSPPLRSVSDNRQWYNNSGNYQGSNQYVHWKPSGGYSVEDIIIYASTAGEGSPANGSSGRSVIIRAFLRRCYIVVTAPMQNKPSCENLANGKFTKIVNGMNNISYIAFR